MTSPVRSGAGGSAPEAGGRRPAGRALLCIVVAWTLATLPTLPGQALTKAAQARAWCVARTMAETGDLAIPRYQGESRLKKPPLQSWLQAATMRVAGRTDLEVAGLATLLVGVLFALTPWLLGRALGAEEAGLVGALLLCASRAALTWGASPEHDVPFAGWTGLSWVFLARALAPTGRPRDVVGSGVACGLALLTKDPFAPAFVAGTALLLRARPASRGPIGHAAFWGTFAPLALLPVAGWLGVLALRLGSVGAVFDEALRQASGASGAHTKTFPTWLVYTLGSSVKATLPWSPVVLALAGAVGVRARRRPTTAADTPARTARRVPIVALGVALLVLTIVPAKQEHYVLPALVPAALLAGMAVVAARETLPRGRVAVPALLGVAAAALLVARVLAARAAGAAIPGAAAGLAIGAGALAAGWRLARRDVLVAAGLCAAGLVGASGACDEARARRVEDVRTAAAALAAVAAAPERTVYGFEPGDGEAFDTVVAWWRNPYRRLRRVERVAELLDGGVDGGAPFFLLVREDALGSLAPVLPRLTLRGEVAPPAPASDHDRYRVYAPTAPR